MNILGFKLLKLLYWDWFTFWGGSPPPSQPTTMTTNTSNLPEYVRPYVETSLSSAQQQVYDMGPSGNITGIKPYVPYSSDPTAYVAPFSPLQQQSQAGIAGLQVPDAYQQAMGMTGQAGAGALGAAGQAAAGSEQVAGQAAGQSQLAGDIYSRALAQTGQQYAPALAQTGLTAAGLSEQAAQRYAPQVARAGQGAAGYGAMGAGVGAQAVGTQNQLINQIQDPTVMQNLLSTYMDYNLPQQQQLLNQQFDIKSAQEQGAATSSGAFGGTRQALMSGLGQQNRALAQSDLIGKAYNAAYQDSLNALAQNVNQNIQRQGLGIQGAQTGLTGQQAAMQGYNQAGALGLQGAQQYGALGMQGLAQGANVGLQGYQQAGATALQGAQQAGALGLQGYNQAGQLGLQGYNQYGNMANQLGALGGAQLAAQQGILGLQAQTGATQQQQQQNIINQAVQNYAMAQQYPYQQLAFLNSMIRGLPLQATTTQSYQAPPSTLSQISGLGTAGIAGLGLYNAMGSDVRLKENIKYLETLPNGIKWYEFQYKPEYKDEYGAGTYRGAMAHEVEEVNPRAVITMADGHKGVIYALIGRDMETV